VTSLVIKSTELLVFCLPFIKMAAIVGIIAGAVFYLFRARFVRRWLTICTHIAGAVLVLPLVAALLLFLRKKWSIFPDVAYQYAGPSDWTGTEVRWLSNERLLVGYLWPRLRILTGTLYSRRLAAKDGTEMERQLATLDF
jgi:hypothetical protein